MKKLILFFIVVLNFSSLFALEVEDEKLYFQGKGGMVMASGDAFEYKNGSLIKIERKNKKVYTAEEKGNILSRYYTSEALKKKEDLDRLLRYLESFDQQIADGQPAAISDSDRSALVSKIEEIRDEYEELNQKAIKNAVSK